MEKDSKVNDLQMMSGLSNLLQTREDKERLNNYIEEYMNSIRRVQKLENMSKKNNKSKTKKLDK